MPANVYECMFILDTNKVAGDQTAVAKQLHTNPGAEQRRGAGVPSLGGAETGLPDQQPQEGPVLPDVLSYRGEEPGHHRRDFALNEAILRNLIVRIDPKLTDVMLTLGPRRASHGAADGQCRCWKKTSVAAMIVSAAPAQRAVPLC